MRHHWADVTALPWALTSFDSLLVAKMVVTSPLIFEYARCNRHDGVQLSTPL